jgi:hypothetical protein
MYLSYILWNISIVEYSYQSVKLKMLSNSSLGVIILIYTRLCAVMRPK